MQALILAIALLAVPADKSFFEKNPPLSTCDIVGVDREKTASIRRWLSVMPASTQLAIDFIEIHARRDDEAFTGARVGYCFKCEKSGRIEIHILLESLDPGTIWHEAQHAYDLWRNEIGKIRWTRAMGDGGKNRERRFPSRGVLTHYGSSAWLEDKADWVKKIYEYLSDRGNVFAKIRDRADPRYLKKLEILRSDGSICKEDFEKIKQLLESH